MKIFQLGQRLGTCAGLVRQGAKVADVGTDHALLPIWLILSGKISFAVASDVRVGPLQAAAANAEKYGVTGRLVTKLSNGLQGVSEEEADDVIIAGMGGELISLIVSEAQWLKNPEKRLILQPMTAAAKLRRSLAEMGFALLSEHAVMEGEKLYSVMEAAFTGTVKLTCVEEYIGKIRPGTEAAARYGHKTAAALRKKAEGLLCAGQTQRCADLLALADEVENVFGGIS